MIVDFSQYRFFLRPGKTDLRKGINGLSVLIQNTMEHNPFSKSLFLFCNKRRKLLKILYWDRNGFCLWMKKLDHRTFPWPQNEAAARELRFEELKMLLDGIDFFKAHEELHYSRV
jgi:transposase